MIYLNSEPYKKHFYADKWSCGTLFCVTMLSGLILIPIFVGLATGNFWISQLETTETPIVNFRNEIIIFNYETSTTGTGPTLGLTSGYSSDFNLLSSFSNKIKGLSVQSTSIDSDRDGRPESFHFEISFRVDTVAGTTKRLALSQMYLFFDYGFRDKIRLQMQDYLKIGVSSQTSIRKANVAGTISFFQESPIQSSKITRSIYNTSVFSEPVANLNLMTLDTMEAQRNESLFCTGCTTTVFSEDSSGGLVEIVIDLAVPSQQSIWYVPTLFYNIKFAWVQFIFLFIPLYVVVRAIRSFAFNNKIFDHYETHDLPYKTK